MNNDTWREKILRENNASIEKILRNRILGARKMPVGSLNLEVISLLKEMAESDVYPDGRFGDDEVCVWEMFRNTMRRGATREKFERMDDMLETLKKEV